MRSLLTALLLCVLPAAAHAQFVARPHLDWQTIQTEHFIVHYPAQYREWTQAVVSRLESARTAVGDIIGFVPTARVQVVIDDPTNVSNGFALPFVDQPTMVFYPVPPSPRQSIGNSRDWGELLAVHEFAHLAHLARPARRPFDPFRLLPVHVGPIMRGVPAWVTEGYATFVEGRVTGSGRPNNAQRAALLRQWALEGRLPTYAQLSGSSAYNGRAFPYLGGSAYLDWLAAREGDSTITHLWRRMTARTRRSFPQAFAGVYGRRPEDLYGRFSAEVTGSALAIERRIVDSLGGVVEGELVQRLAWETGDPAISPDGSRVAIVLCSATRPGRVVVWNSAPDTVPARVAAEREAARERARRRDSLDVPDRQFYPPARRALATLEARDGRGFDTPRFMPDGRHVLVTRAEPVGGGAYRPDVYLWDTKDGDTRRVTQGAAVRLPDPERNGTSAVAVQCTRGWCDLVRVDLVSGAVVVLREGSPSVTYYRPRISPAGDRIAVAVQERNQWRIDVIDATGSVPGARTSVPGSATRFDVSWRDDTTLIVVSEASGITNLERVDVASGRIEPFTRVLGGAFAPEVNRATDHVWFLSLHSRGLDVRQIPASTPTVDLPAAEPNEFPAIPAQPATAPMLAMRDDLVERPYGAGPRSTRVLPGATVDAGSAGAQLFAINGDPVGRLELALLGTAGSRSAWQGARTWMTVRRWRPTFSVEAFHAQQQPADAAPARPAALDISLTGGGLRTHGQIDRSAWRASTSLGVAAMRTGRAGADSGGAARSVGWAVTDVSGSTRILGVGLAGLASVRGDAGRHGSHRIGHVVTTGAIRADAPFIPAIQATVVHARNTSAMNAPAFEQVAVGGAVSPLLDTPLLPNRLSMPVMPAGALVGSEATTIRADVALGTFSPYAWTARVADTAAPDWNRVVGVEARFSTGAFPLVTLPRAEFVGGIGHSFDEPHRGRTAVYLNVTYRP
ncbi:MAG: hypothetical protein H0X64_04845 [Gemmatimonadaceae bacterium]|nr:hypothetical protein [Gemmatimonadaceae bacterium]